MTDDHDDLNRKSHWQSLAEEFGLPPDSKSEPAPVKAERPPAPPPRVKVAPPPPPPEPVVQRAEPETAEAAFEPAIKPAEPLNLDHISLDLDDHRQAPPEPPRPKRGGGRRQRSRPAEESPPAETPSRAAEETGEAQPEAEKPTPEPRQEEDRSPRRKRSRRGTKGTTPKSEVVSGKGEVSQGEPVAAVAEDDDEEAEARSISTWNLPSWQELISSLYRPDR